ncbi:hypothetical protein F7725_011261 [Dissostichus mawsoni]|uniref:Uncharacterized protein n=1 Tax=Dissostichus mawsoni TaxID=36200 RepID=A0A7J5Z8W8_DISMA|nr:hypothetical protein F7725_011261 [Dissostichus mawsoni]
MYGVVFKYIHNLLIKKHQIMLVYFDRNQPMILNEDTIDQNAGFDLSDCKIQGTEHGTQSDFSFYNDLYNPSSNETDATVTSSDA